MKTPECASCFSAVRALASPQGCSSLRFPRQRSQVKLARSKSSQWEVLSTISTTASEGDCADSTLSEASQEELNAAAGLQAIVEADDALLALVRRHQAGESIAALCMRFTRARPQGQAQALELLTGDMRYREENKTHLLAQMALSDVFGIGQSPQAQAVQEAVCQQVPHGILGFSKQGHVILYRSYSGIRLWELESRGISTKQMIRHHQWVTEKSLRAIGHKGRVMQVVNIGGAGLSQATSRAHLAYGRMLAELDSAHYPERLATIFIINAPRFFSSTFKIISSWLDDRTKARIQLLGGPEAWRGPLSEHMDLRLLPRDLGGEVDLTFESQAAPAMPLFPCTHSRSISSAFSGSTEDDNDEELDKDREDVEDGEDLLAKLTANRLVGSSSAAGGGSVIAAGVACRTTTPRSSSYWRFASVLLAVTVVLLASATAAGFVSTDPLVVA
jgi:hypothetical protein